MNDKFVGLIPRAPLESIIIAWRGGSTEPPSIAMMRPAAPIFASSPTPSRARPYIVGNISDIQPETATRQYSPARPPIKITPSTKTDAMIESSDKSLSALTYFIMKVQMKRLQQNIIIATILYFCESTSASISLNPSPMKTRVPYWIMNVQHIICAPT